MRLIISPPFMHAWRVHHLKQPRLPRTKCSFCLKTRCNILFLFFLLVRAMQIIISEASRKYQAKGLDGLRTEARFFNFGKLRVFIYMALKGCKRSVAWAGLLYKQLWVYWSGLFRPKAEETEPDEQGPTGYILDESTGSAQIIKQPAYHGSV